MNIKDPLYPKPPMYVQQLSSTIYSRQFFLKFYLFIYFWLCCVFIAEHGFPLAVVSRGSSLIVVLGLSCSSACGIFLVQGSTESISLAGSWIPNHWTTREVQGTCSHENKLWIGRGKSRVIKSEENLWFPKLLNALISVKNHWVLTGCQTPCGAWISAAFSSFSEEHHWCKEQSQNTGLIPEAGKTATVHGSLMVAELCVWPPNSLRAATTFWTSFHVFPPSFEKYWSLNKHTLILFNNWSLLRATNVAATLGWIYKCGRTLGPFS